MKVEHYENMIGKVSLGSTLYVPDMNSAINCVIAFDSHYNMRKIPGENIPAGLEGRVGLKIISKKTTSVGGVGQ